MKLLPIIFFIVGLLTSCSHKTNTDKLESRDMYAFKTRHAKDAKDSLAFYMPYRLQILEQDTVVIYKYLNSIDSTKNMIFRFNPETHILTFGPFNFELIKSDFFNNKELTENNFDLYDLRIPVTDGNGPTLFNREYGVLNVDNSYWTYHYLFLTAGHDNDKIAENILNKFNE